MRRLLLLLALLPLSAWAQSSATYQVTFESTWSAATHPDNFPSNAHFSGLVGGTHTDAVRLWALGEIASEGFADMAETGSKTALIAEVDALIGAGEGGAVLSGSGIGPSPGAVSLTFEIGEDVPLVSLVSMLAPSPDWFVGVADLALHDGGGWVPEITVPLVVYDAGTDSGGSYTAPNADTNPAEAIVEITGPPFLVASAVPPVGTFTFTLLTATPNEASPDAATFALDAPAPNPATDRTTFTLRLDRAQAVQVEVFDLLGRRIQMLHDGTLAAGTHPLTLDASRLPGGLYVVRARGISAQATRRLVVQRR